MKKTDFTFTSGPDGGVSVGMWPRISDGKLEPQVLRRGDLMPKAEAAQIIARCQARQIAAELEADQADASWRDAERRAQTEREAHRQIVSDHIGPSVARSIAPFPEPLPRVPYTEREGVGAGLLDTLRDFATDNMQLRLELEGLRRDADDATAERAEAMRRLDVASRVGLGYWCGTESEPRRFGKVRSISHGMILAGLWPFRRRVFLFTSIKRVTRGYVVIEGSAL